METSNMCTRKTFKWQHLHFWKTHDKFTIVISYTKSNEKNVNQEMDGSLIQVFRIERTSKVKKKHGLKT